MDSHALQVLEFDKVKELLLRFTASTLGQEAVDALRPYTYAKAVREALQETSEMTRLYEAHQEPPLDGVFDVRQPLRQSAVPGAILDPAEIILIGETVTAAGRIRSCLRKTKVDAPHIRIFGDRLIPHPEVEEALKKVFDEQKNIRDTASHHLARVRKAIRLQRDDLIRRLEKLMRGSWKEYLQEPYYTQREGRYVLPVDTHHQGKARGIIHDRSSSGTTVYIEPMELVEDGNRLKELHREEEIEIRKILRELTALIAECHEDLEFNLEIFRHLDLLSAKARFSLIYGLNPPVIRETGALRIFEGRHPLLLAKRGSDGVVPLNLDMPDNVRGLVVTGPNTGGKTVVLKTVGLLVLMAQCGLPIPAKPSSEIPVFESIWADIGDEQSLEQSLSTFSSHMQNIRSLLETANRRSLVLLDELGSGTDPVEGGALSCAILHKIREQGAVFLATTHLQELKLYAYQTPGVVNGAMEFNLQSLEPTYSFSMGLPGQSNAIQIANRLGLPVEVIQWARERVKKMGDSPEDILIQMGEELRHTRSLRQTAEQDCEKALNLKKESERKIEKALAEGREIRLRAERKAQHLIHELERKIQDMEKSEAEFKQEWRDKLASVLKEPSPAKPPVLAIQDLKKELAAVKQNLELAHPKPLEEFMEERQWTWEQLQPGVRVRIAGLSGAAEVLRASQSKKEVEVTISSMNLRVKSDRIAAILGPRLPKMETEGSGVSVERPENVKREIELHGMTVDEMTPLLQQYLDRAFLAGLPSVTIVHGYGMGILRHAVRKMLKENPTVVNFRSGEDYEGGMGVTVAEFRRQD
ncbi:MAG: endonuclease MutS2 [Candidatus Omnitrophota bacterium]